MEQASSIIVPLPYN